jgi:pilus assembly protein CpaE
MNRAGAYFGKDALTIKKAEDVLGRLIYAQVPNDYKPMMEAWNAGVPLVQSAPSSKAQQAIATLAEDICRRLAGPEGRDATKKRLTTTRIIKTPVIKPPDAVG